MRHRAVAVMSVLVLAGALVMPTGTAAAHSKGASNTGGTSTSNASQGAAAQKTKKRPPRAYSGKDPQSAARNQGQ